MNYAQLVVDHAVHSSDTMRFVGRQRELAALHADIEQLGLDTLAGRPSPHCRVLLIAGRPGSGRSALAAELVRQLTAAGRYPGGVLYARLTDPDGRPVPSERTARRLLETLRVATDPGADAADLLSAARAALASRPGILFLDDAATRDQLLDLLPRTADSLVVVTAEGPLTGVPDIRPCALGGLDQEAAIELLVQGAGPTRVTVDPRAAEALAEECGGQPAALVLVAGWLAAHPEVSVADVLSRLRAMPSTPLRTEEPTSVPLARAFCLVQRALSTVRTAHLLALAPEGFVDAQIASALAGSTVASAQATLDGLAAFGLLRPWHPLATVPTPSGAGGSASGGRRYAVPRCLHPLLRAQLAARERPADVVLARARMLERTVRHLHSCWASAEPPGSPARVKAAALPRSLRFASAAAASCWLREHLPRLVAAARFAVEDGEGELDTLARRLLFALVRALHSHRDPRDAAPELYQLHQLGLEVAERRGLHRERAAALLDLGDLDIGCGRSPRALDHYRAALDAARRGDDAPATRRALESLGATYDERGDGQRAADWYGRALVLCQTGGDLEGEARLYGLIGAAYRVAGQATRASREWRAAAAVYRRLRDLPRYAHALGEVARAQLDSGLSYEALRTCHDALEAARRAGEPSLESALRRVLAGAYAELGDLANARAHRAAAESLSERRSVRPSSRS